MQNRTELVEAMPDLATVTRIRAAVVAEAHARSLRWTRHDVEPNIGRQPIDHIEWTIETRLHELWDRDLSPWSILTLWAPEHQERAERLLLELFNAADEIHQYGGSLRLLDDYSDVLHQLARLAQGVVVA